MAARNSVEAFRHTARLVGCVLFFPVLLWPAASGAEMCALDDVPAATILVPHFEVDLAETGGPETSVVIFNAGPQATIAHVTLWTDAGVPTFGFGIQVSAFGTRVVILRKLFDGDLPPWLCDSSLTLDAAEIGRLRDAHTGQPVDGGTTCLGSNQGDGLARGFLTIDMAQRCSGSNPSEAGYFDGASPVAGFANQLFAKVFHSEAGVRTVAPAVHLEADAAFDATSTARGTTFYSRFAAGGVDGREPLPSLWGVPLHLSAVTDSEWTVWRGGESFGSTPAGFPCSDAPETQPVAAVHCFDRVENHVQLCFGGDCLGLESQRISPASDGIDSPYLGGWCILDLAVPSDDSDGSQAWVGSGVSYGTLTASPEAPGAKGIALSPFCEPRTGGEVPRLPNLFYDDFESGDLSAWSGNVGGS